MTRPIPIFRFVFAAYYSTAVRENDEAQGFFKKTERLRNVDAPLLSLVVDNDAAAPRPSRFYERVSEFKGD